MLLAMANESNGVVEKLLRQLAEASRPEVRLQTLLQISDVLCDSAPKQAERYLRQAITEARTGGFPAFAGLALNDLAFLKFQEGNLAEASELCAESLALAEQHGLRRVEASARNVLGLTFWQKGEHAKAMEHYEECLRISREIDYDGGMMAAFGNLASSNLSLGKTQKALEFYQESLRLTERIKEEYPVAITLGNMGHCYEELGDWERALEYYYRGLAAAEQLDLKTTISEILASLGSLFSKRGRIARALELYGRAAAVAEEIAHADLKARIHGELCGVRLLDGDLVAARNELDKSRALAQALDDKEEIARCERRRAELLLALGELPEARGAVAAALELDVRMGYRIERGISLRVLGEIGAVAHEVGPARTAFEQAVAILTGGEAEGTGPGFGYQLALAHFALGRFLAESSETENALSHVRQAAALFRRLGIVQSAEAANRFLFTIQDGTRRTEDRWFSILQSLSNLATWPAPTSELVNACLTLLTTELRYQGGALFFYSRQPQTVGRIQRSALLALSRKAELTCAPDQVQIPIIIRGRNVGMLYLCDPAPDTARPDQAFWEIVSHLLSLMTERIETRVRGPESEEVTAGAPSTAARAEPPEIELRFGNMIAGSAAMKAVLDQAERVAPTRAGVLIRGGSGTGKELVARTIHDLSPRHDQPLVVINCAALPESLLEAELLGIEKGAATGVRARPGKLEQADGGTVFLDEIGDMSLALQAKVLRAIQERSFERVGGSQTIAVDVRFIAATNRDLEAAVKAGTFREDLFHRLNVVTLELPPLRERKDEIPTFVEHFITKYSEEFVRPVQAMTAAAMDALLAYSWPGNVRELENAIERAVIVAREGIITREDLPPAIQTATVPGITVPPETAGLKAVKRAARRQATASLERDFILRMLEKHDWRVPDVLREIGISKSHFYRLLEKYDIRRER
jgi:transcriptional regulator with GAF, ATPase, and Fis domain/tetratricopeptide (TPR) repeat protein